MRWLIACGRLAALLWTGALLACSANPSRDEPAPRTPLTTGLHLVEDLRLDGHREDYSDIIDDLVLGPDGRAVVVDAWRFQLIFYDSSGSRLGTFGRRGEGPGEFKVGGVTRAGPRANIRIGVAGDSLWVWDHTARRITFVSWAGSLLSTVRLNPRSFAQALRSESPVAGSPHRLCPNGEMLGTASFRSGTNRESRYVRFSPAMADIQTIASPPPRSDAAVTVASRVGPPVEVSSLFPRHIWKADFVPGRCALLIVDTDLAEASGIIHLTEVGPTADTVRRLQLAAIRVPVDRENAVRLVRSQFSDLAKARLGDSMLIHDGGDVRAAERAALNAIPEWQPDVRGVKAGGDGTFALLRPPSGDSMPLTLFTADGTERGTVHIRHATGRILQLTHDHLWRTEYDDDGVVSVVRYRIVEV
jgi:hypothetical protein